MNIKNKIVNTTIENILNAAKNNPQSEKTLKYLFPKAFESNKPFIKIGQLFIRNGYNNLYVTIVEIRTGNIRIHNLNTGKGWNNTISIKGEGRICPITLTIAEFEELTGSVEYTKFTPIELPVKDIINMNQIFIDNNK
jgi:hypothetical protein